MVVLVLLAAYFLVPQVWDKLSPFFIAIPLAAMLQPVIRFCFRKLKLKKSISSLILVLLLLGLVIGVLIWLIGLVTSMVNPFFAQSEDIVTSTIGTIRQAVNSLMQYTSDNFTPEIQAQISKALSDMIESLRVWGLSASGAIASYLVNLATGFPYFIIYTTFLAMALYFIARDYDDIRSYLPGGKRRKQDSRTTQLTNSTLKSLFGYLRVQGTFGVIVWIISWIYLTAFGFRYAGITALCCGIMELVPMIGSGVPYILMSLLQFLLGRTRLGILLLILTLTGVAPAPAAVGLDALFTVLVMANALRAYLVEKRRA
jgi:predicted PurR-regulated permease PerM